jgi:plasmid stability protein
MPSIHIRDLSQGTLARLKARARRHGRSFQAEVKTILDQAAQVDWSRTRALAARLRRELADTGQSDSAELIAADRRSR